MKQKPQNDTITTKNEKKEPIKYVYQNKIKTIIPKPQKLFLEKGRAFFYFLTDVYISKRFF